MLTSKAKQGHANTMPIDSNLIDNTGGRGRRPLPPVLSIALEYMGMVLACPCLALEAKIFEKLLFGLEGQVNAPIESS